MTTIRRTAARAAGLLVALLIAGCKVTSQPICFQTEYGDCGGLGPTPVNLVVGFPDSLVSIDHPTNQGVLTVGDSVVLRYVRSLTSSGTVRVTGIGS
jgi:hypothetical protein